VNREPLKGIELAPSDRLIMIVGNYGSGKTEVAVNLSLLLRERGQGVQIADLDIVNPYFRCREARALMEERGIRVVVPPATHTYADLPIVVPQIKGMLNPPEGEVSLFDVGGDEVGAKLLSSFHEALGDSPYALWQVINSRRPFTDTAEGCLAMREGIERAARLKVTGLIVNSHLIQETTPEVILEGYRLAQAVSARSGIPVVFVAAMEEFADDPALAALDVPVLRMKRRMLPPWIQNCDEPLPAGRAVPIGKAKGVA
jgi:energy-coupling factor transporter ATP-binding protein EcfA2